MKKILLIEDNADSLNLPAVATRDYGWELFKAFSVREAEELLRQRSYDVVCIDFSLENGTAVEYFRFHTGTSC